jgi:RTX calcium-binding nonapeptide repeat (4 copies)
MTTYNGTDSADSLVGGAANDSFNGGSGDDSLYGAGGIDTANFGGSSAGYGLSAIGNSLAVSDLVSGDGNDGVDTLTEIEQLSFAGETVTASSGELRVNTHTASYYQDFSSITALANGGFVVSWSSSDQDGSNYGVYAQRYNDNGAAIGSEFRVNTYTSNIQYWSSSAALADGGFVVSWTSEAQDGEYEGIYAQRYNASGVAIGSEFRVNTYVTNTQTDSCVTGLADGGFVVSWTSIGQDGSNGGIYAQRYNSSGVEQGGEFRINSYVSGTQNQSRIAALADGGFLVSWTTYGPDGDGYGIYAKRYNSSSLAVGSEFRVNTYTTFVQEKSSLVALANGGFVIGWSSFGQDGDDFGIYAQMYDSNGAAVGGEFRVSAYAASWQTDSGIAALLDGGFVVCWTSNG